MESRPDSKYFFSKIFLDAIAPQEGLEKRVLLADITAKEIIFHKVNRALSNYEKLSNALEVLRTWSGRDLTSPLSREELFSDIQRRFIDARNDAGFSPLPTPFNDINWEQIVDDAVWRRAPFEGTGMPEDANEKGFRDSIFVETTLATIRKEPASYWYILTRDQKIIEKLKGDALLTSDDSKVEFVETIEEFAGKIKMLVAEYEAMAVKLLPGIAQSLFFNSANSTGLWVDQKIFSKIIKSFQKEIEAPPGVLEHPLESEFKRGLATIYALSQVSWNKRQDNRMFSIGTRFVRKEGDGRIKWATRIDIYTMFERGSTIFTAASAIDTLIRQISIDVFWSSKAAILVLSDPTFIGMDFAGSRNIGASFSNCLRLGFQSPLGIGLANDYALPPYPFTSSISQIPLPITDIPPA